MNPIELPGNQQNGPSRMDLRKSTPDDEKIELSASQLKGLSRLPLFEKIDFILNSGTPSDFKIECDSLLDHDIDTFAHLIQKKYQFSKVIGVPTGGTRIQDALQNYASNDHTLPLLIVDDVLTTGNSMNKLKAEMEEKGFDNIIGVVLFARGGCPEWIKPVFQMW